MNSRRQRVFAEINAERMRQVELLAAGKIRQDCADPEVDADRKLRALAQGVGGVAQAIDAFDHNGAAKSTDEFFAMLDGKREHLRAELVQVAAVAAAWAESLLPKKEVRP